MIFQSTVPEYVLKSEGIKEATENEHLSQIKKSANDKAREEKSAANSYAKAISKERLENPLKLLSNIESARKDNQATKEMGKVVKGGPTANVQSTVNKLGNVEREEALKAERASRFVYLNNL
ncbi:hypothetical protein Glove_187g94 [Diversispora epigaea]|uniref:Uncharacterized protein n=1 Tax=Diversispora epigaea TaxID=1348612 RepID=A0A397IRI1_9GLOM|nr:hypothetical protein Glove_187g94 [Diversispora epigaea]